jgi:enamine deaminase RidA (YjgF/YER057c/UK114 family)
VTATRPVFASPPELFAPAGYSHVVTIPAGRLAWTAGQVPMTPEREVPDGWEAQTRLAFQNAGRALRAAGAEWSDVVKLTIHVTELSELATIRRVRDEFVDTAAPPTSSLVEVAALFDPNVLLEVEAVAFLPDAD